MLYFFDDDALREFIELRNLPELPERPLDHTLESLFEYTVLWEEVLQSRLRELKEESSRNCYLGPENREAYNLLSRVGDMILYLDKVYTFADESGQLDQLKERLKYLGEYADETRCVLQRDFAPMSFAFVMQKKKDGEWAPWFNGGLIHHGKHDNGGDGGAPTYSVNLNSSDGWMVHT